MSKQSLTGGLFVLFTSVGVKVTIPQSFPLHFRPYAAQQEKSAQSILKGDIHRPKLHAVMDVVRLIIYGEMLL